MSRVQDLLNQGRRYCWYVSAELHDEKRGYRACMVIENEPGFFPTGGGNVEPWYWGKDFALAERTAEERNTKMGLSAKDVLEIIASSMKASREAEHASKG